MKKIISILLILILCFISYGTYNTMRNLDANQALGDAPRVLTVSQGGTGAATLTGCLTGNGISPITGTGSACGSGGGGSSFTGPINSVVTTNGSGTLIATGTQLTVGNLLATTTAATSTFRGNVLITPNGDTTYGFNSWQAFEVVGSTNNPFQINVVNRSTGPQALSSVFLANDKTVNNGFSSTYYGGITLAGSNYNTPGANAVRPNGMAIFASDGPFSFGSAATNAASSTIFVQSGQGLNISYDAAFMGGFGNFVIGTTSLKTVNGIASYALADAYSKAKIWISSSTIPQLALEGADTDNIWNLRSIGNNLYIATSSPTTYATSSASALKIDQNGFLTISANAGTGCGQFDTNGKLTNTNAGCGTLTSITAGAGLQNQGTVITTNGTLTGAIATATTPLVNPAGLPYWISAGNASTPATLGSTATSTLAGTGPISVSNSPFIIGGSGAVISCTSATVSVTGCLLASDFSKFNSATTTFSTGLTYTGGTNAVTVNTSQSITILSNLGTNGYVKTSGGTGTLGVQTVPIPFADGGTGFISLSPNSILTSNSGGTGIIATGTQLTVGNLIATTSATSYFLGNVGIGTTTAPSALTIGSTAAGLASLNPQLLFGTSTLVAASSAGTYVGVNSPTGFSGDYINLQNAGSAGFQVSPANQGLILLGTTSPASNNLALMTVPGKLVIATTTTSQITLQGNTGENPVSIRSVGGAFYISTSSPTTQATSTLPALGFNASGQIILNNYGTCNGTGNALGTTNSIVTCDSLVSDMRLKKEVNSLENGLDIINKLKPVTFFWKDLTNHNTTDPRKQYGFIAQDVQNVLPSAVGESPDGYLTLDKASFIAPMIEAIQTFYKEFQTFVADMIHWNNDQDKSLKKLEDQVTSQQKEIDELKAQINKK